MRKAKEMPYHRGLVVKLYPSDRQKHIIALNDGAKRAVYNFLVATNNEQGENILRTCHGPDCLP